MNLSGLTSRDAVLQALAEYDDRGRDKFLDDYGFGKAQSYYLQHGGRLYDSKAIVGVALHFQTGQSITAADFSGGGATVKRKLEELGFVVDVLDTPQFVVGRTYHRRSEILGIYGGQWGRGIATPADRPYIFLFSGESRRKYGYIDDWQDDEVYIFTGEGPEGDMTLTGGNLDVCDHQKDGKDLHLFLLDPKRPDHAQYQGRFLCIGYHWADGLDQEGNTRRIIRFELIGSANFKWEGLGSPTEDEAENEAKSLSLDELRERAKTDGASSGTTQERKQAAYRRSVWVKWYAWKRADGNCEGCGIPAPFLTPKNRPYLEVHHLHSMADGGPDLPM